MKDKILLVTGGTGSLGQALVKYALALAFAKIIVFSRNEFDQYEMEQELPSVSCVLGDVRDRDALLYAFKDVTHIIHCAALKHVRKCEDNPIEAVDVNIGGAKNIIHAAIERGVRSVLAVSSDKAVNPINLYGATKLVADKLFVSANKYNATRFSVIRPGNFANSRGSVEPLFEQLRNKEQAWLPIHDLRMTRFYITLEQAAECCFTALDIDAPGWIFAPKMPSYRLVDLARHIHPAAELREIGIDRGEKLHEALVIAGDGITINAPGFYITLPNKALCSKLFQQVTENITSETNTEWVFQPEPEGST